MESACLVLETGKQLSKVVVPFYISSSNVWEIWLGSIFTPSQALGIIIIFSFYPFQKVHGDISSWF